MSKKVRRQGQTGANTAGHRATTWAPDAEQQPQHWLTVKLLMSKCMLSFCMPIWLTSVVRSKRKQFLHKNSHNKICGLSGETESRFLERGIALQAECHLYALLILGWTVLLSSSSNFTRKAMICLRDWSRLLCTLRASTFLSQLDIQQATTCSMSTHYTGLTTPTVTIKLFTVTLNGRRRKNSVWKHSFELLVNTVGW